MSITKTNIPHTYLVEYQSPSTMHRGVMYISYCKDENDAINKAKKTIGETQKNSKEYLFAVR